MKQKTSKAERQFELFRCNLIPITYKKKSLVIKKTHHKSHPSDEAVARPFMPIDWANK